MANISPNPLNVSIFSHLIFEKTERRFVRQKWRRENGLPASWVTLLDDEQHGPDKFITPRFLGWLAEVPPIQWRGVKFKEDCVLLDWAIVSCETCKSRSQIPHP